MSERATVSLGVAASVGPELAAQLAPLAEAAGFSALWVNDTPDADALAVLESAARSTERLRLATGVLPVDRRSASDIARAVTARSLPRDRLVLGIGSGQARTGALRLVRDAAADLHASVGATVVVGALGPKMRRLAVDESEGVLLSWLTPDVAREQTAEAHAAAGAAHVALYVRAAFDPAARQRLHAETTRYAGYPSYSANFSRTGIDPFETIVDAAGPMAERLEDYRGGVDEVVLRAITAAETLDEYRRFLDAARPLL